MSKIISDIDILKYGGTAWTNWLGYIFYGLCRQIKAKTILELGILDGYTSLWLARAARDNTIAAKDNKSMYYGIDIEEKYIHKLHTTLLEFKDLSKHVITHIGNSLYTNWERETDFIFFDSNHSYLHVKAELEKYLPWVKKGGFIAVHDYNSYKGCQQACDKSFNKNEWDIILIPDQHFGASQNGCGTLLCKRKE